MTLNRADFGDVLTLLDKSVPRGTELHVLSERTAEHRRLLGLGDLENLAPRRAGIYE